GMVSLPRFWQGKCILWSCLMPMSLLFCVRFLDAPSWRRFAYVFLCGICSVGLSNAGVFLCPAEVFCASIAYFLSDRPSLRRLRPCLTLNLAFLYPLAAGAIFAAGHPDLRGFTVGAECHWWLNMFQMVIGSFICLARNFVLLFLIPLATPLKQPRRFLLLYSLVAVAAFM